MAGWCVLWPPGSRRWAALSLFPVPGREQRRDETGRDETGAEWKGRVYGRRWVLALLCLESSSVALVTVWREATVQTVVITALIAAELVALPSEALLTAMGLLGHAGLEPLQTVS